MPTPRVVLYLNTSGARQGVAQNEVILVSGIQNNNSSVLADGANVSLLASGNVTVTGTAIAVNGTTIALNGPVTTVPKLVTAANSTLAAVEIGSFAGDPSALVNGDIWYNSTINRFRKYENGMVSGFGGSEAATFVVHPTAGIGDFTDIQSAVNALPAAGGLIIVREGTYMISSTITLPDKPVVIRGCGGSSVVQLTAAVPIFTIPGTVSANQEFSFELLDMTGTSSAGQHVFSVAANVVINLRNCQITAIDSIVNTTVAPTVLIAACPTISGRAMWTGVSGGNLFIENSAIINSTIAVSGNPRLRLLGTDVTGGSTAAIAADSSLIAGKLTIGTITPSGNNCRFVGVEFSTTNLAITTTNNIVSGCIFLSGATATESGGADFNTYDSNSGLVPTIVGHNSIVCGVKRYDQVGGSTTGSFVTLFTHTNPKGVVGIGTIKNTGIVNDLQVRETVIDAFGVTDNTTVIDVSPGNTYLLDPQTNFGLAHPPYVSYKVEVMHPTAVTTFEVHHATEGAV